MRALYQELVLPYHFEEQKIKDENGELPTIKNVSSIARTLEKS